MSDASHLKNVTELVADGYTRLLAPAITTGARFALVSPASAAKHDRVRDGADLLRQLGYAPVHGRHCLGSGPLYFSGTVAERLDDLHAAFADTTIDAVICTRGGWGSAELLAGLDLDLIRAHPKPLLGYSDVTSLHTWIGQQTGLITFHGPMVSADFARVDGVDLASFEAALTGASEWRVGAAEGLRLLRAPLGDVEAAPVEGVLVGGCLSIFCEALGTPFAPVPREGTILFLEDVGTKPYQWDRMLLHLRYAGLLEGVKAIVLGNMGQCVPAAENDLLEAALLHALREFSGPICIGLRSGHVDGANVTLPLGARVELGLGSLDGPALRAVGPTVVRRRVGDVRRGEV